MDFEYTTDSLRAVACIRFVRPGLSVQGARLWGNLMWAMACRGGVDCGNPMLVLGEMEDKKWPIKSFVAWQSAWM